MEIVLDNAAIRDFLRGEEMQNLIKEHAEAVKNRAGDGYEVNVYVGRNRCNASVGAKTTAAKLDNARNNTLLKAVSK